MDKLDEGSSKQVKEVGVPCDTTTKVYSAQASVGMDVLSRQCAGESCTKGPLFGFEGGKKAINLCRRRHGQDAGFGGNDIRPIICPKRAVVRDSGRQMFSVRCGRCSRRVGIRYGCDLEACR